MMLYDSMGFLSSRKCFRFANISDFEDPYIFLYDFINYKIFKLPGQKLKTYF